jgi:hypothetical protein
MLPFFPYRPSDLFKRLIKMRRFFGRANLLRHLDKSLVALGVGQLGITR